jgi:2-haloalkanoic acid dehalogenase type II
VIDLILFDLDGTLVDHRGAVLAAIEAVVRDARSARLPADELVQLWWDLERIHMRHYLDGECSFAEQRRRRLREFLPSLGQPVPGDAELDSWFARRYLPAFEAAWSCYPDVLPALQALAELPGGPRRVVLTNGDPAQQCDKLARFGLLSYFEAVLTPTDLGSAKPDPAAFAAACRRLDVVPARALSVGDWLTGDVIAAARAGLSAVWLDRGIDPMSGRPYEPGTATDSAPARIESLTGLVTKVQAARLKTAQQEHRLG